MRNRRLLLLALSVLLLAAPAVRAATLPRSAPGLKIRLADGSQVPLSHFKGKVVALAFILTSCPHCQHTVRCLTQYQKEFGPRGFQAVASAIEDMAKINLPEFNRLLSPNFPVGFNNVNEALDFMQYPPMVAPYMPLVAFIDRDGVIKAQYGGRDPFLEQTHLEANIRAKIAELLDQPGGNGKKAASPKRH